MRSNQTIQRVIAAAFILLFTLSVAPKQWLHNLITGHKHSFSKFNGHENVQASQKNIQCNWHDQQIESPFIDQPGFQLLQPLPSYSSYVNQYSFNYCSSDISLSSLRGPPSQLPISL